MTDSIDHDYIPDDPRDINPLAELDKLKLVLVSVVRTFVPLAANSLVAIGLDVNTATVAAASLVALALYTIVRVFEVFVSPKVGILLGWVSAPQYAAAEKGADV